MSKSTHTHQPRWQAALNRAASLPLVDSLTTCPGPKERYVSFDNSLVFKYQYNLAFYAFTGKLFYLLLYNFYGIDLAS